MKKRIICLLLCAVTLLPSLTAPVSAAPKLPPAQRPIICNREIIS